MSETFTFASDEEMPWENFNEKIVPDQSHDEQQDSSSESVSIIKPGGNTKEFETNRKTDVTVHADTKESDGEELHVSSVDNTDNKQRNVRISTCTKHNKRLQPPSVTTSRTDTESRLTRTTISEALNERTKVKENVINRREKITKHQGVTLQKHNEDTREDSDDLEQEDRTRRKPANIRRNKKMRKLPRETVQSSVECDRDDDDDLELEDRTGRKPASIEKKKMRKSPSETVQSSAQSDSEQENLKQNGTGRKPVSIRRKRKLRKAQSNTVQSSVESDNEVDDDLEQEDITERKQASIRKKKMGKSPSATVQGSGEWDCDDDLEHENRSGRKPVPTRDKKMRKPQSETVQSSAQSDSEEDLEQGRTGRKPVSIREKKMRKPQSETVQSSAQSDSEEDLEQDRTGRKPVSIREKKMRKPQSETEQSSAQSDSEEDLEQDRTGTKPVFIKRKKSMGKPQGETVKSSVESVSEADNIRTASANIRQRRNLRKSTAVAGNKKTNKQARDVSLSATELSKSDAKHDSEIVENEIPKRHCREDTDNLEQNRAGRKPASIEKKKMRKSPSETEQSSAQSDSEEENLEQNRTGKKPVSIRRKKKLRKTQSNTVQSSVESDREVDDDLEQEDITERKQASIRKKKMGKSPSATVQSSGEWDCDDDLEQEDITERKPASIRKKKMRKSPSEKVQNSAQSDSEQENLEQNRTGRTPVSIRRKRKLREAQGKTVQSSVESDSEVEDDLDDISERKQASIRKKKIAKSPSAMVQSSGECDSEADNIRTASANMRQRRNLKKSATVGGNKKTNKQARDVYLSATELSKSDAKHDSEIAENEIPKRHCREDVRKLSSVKRKKKKTIQRSSSRRKVDANIVKSVTSTVATEEKSVKPRSSAGKSTTVVENITTKQWPVWSSTGDSDNETNEEATNVIHTRKSARANNKLQVNTETTSDSEENNVSTIKARFTNEDINIKHDINIKQRWNLRQPNTDRKRTSLMLRPTFTKEESDTKSMENEEEATKTGTLLEQNPLAHAVKQSKSGRKNSFEQESGAKAKQRKCGVIKSMTTKIMEDMTVEQTLKSSVQGHRDATESDPDGIQKSNRKTAFSKIDIGAGPPVQRPSKRATQRKNCQNASQNIVGNKMYFLRHKLNPTSKLIDVPFDFTQQEDPFHFSGTSEKDNNHCTDESDHNNDGTDLDDIPDYNDIDNDDHHDNYDHHDNDDGGYDYDGDDHGQKISKSSTTTSVHARKSKREKSKPRNTRSSKIRSANEMTEQFTKLRGRPTKNHEFENGNNNLNQSSMVVNDENVILDTKRRRARGKKYNIRQYLIAVDPTDTYEISSDDRE